METSEVKITAALPFANEAEYQYFVFYCCAQCMYGIRNPETGLPEQPENGGCAIWDAAERSRFDADLFPAKDIVRIETNNELRSHLCWHKKSNDPRLAEMPSKILNGRDDG